MKITVETKSLVDAVEWTTKAYNAKNTDAYIAFVMDKNNNAELFYATTEAYLKSNFTITNIEFDGGEDHKKGLSIPLDGMYLKRLASILKSAKGDVEISKDLSDPSSELQIKTSTGDFTVPSFNKRVSKAPELIELGDVDDRAYFDYLQRLSKLCDPTRASAMPVLASVDIKLDVDEKKIIMMATDSYTIGEVSIDFEPSDNTAEYVEENSNILLPVESATIIAAPKVSTGAITLVHEEKGQKFGYLFADGRVALFSLKGKDIQPISYIPLKEKAQNNVANSINVNTVEFKKALGIISNVSWEDADILLVIDENELMVSDVNKKNTISVAIDNIDISEAIEVKFLRAVLDETFSPITTSNMTLKWVADRSMFVITPILDDGSEASNVFVFFVPINKN